MNADPRCPSCVYKHRAAAYVARHMQYVEFDEDTVSRVDVYLARAVIALTEVITGHPENVIVAHGCLCMAETLVNERPESIRQIRLGLDKPELAKQSLIPLISHMAFMTAHRVESVREDIDLVDDAEAEEFASIVQYARAYELEPVLPSSVDKIEHRFDGDDLVST